MVLPLIAGAARGATAATSRAASAGTKIAKGTVAGVSRGTSNTARNGGRISPQPTGPHNAQVVRGGSGVRSDNQRRRRTDSYRSDNVGSDEYRATDQNRLRNSGRDSDANTRTKTRPAQLSTQAQPRLRRQFRQQIRRESPSEPTTLVGNAARTLTAWPMIFGTLGYWMFVQVPLGFAPLAALTLVAADQTLIGGFLTRVGLWAADKLGVITDAVMYLFGDVILATAGLYALICVIFGSFAIMTCYGTFLFTNTRSLSGTHQGGKVLLFALAIVGSLVPMLPWTTMWVWFVTRHPK